MSFEDKIIEMDKENINLKYCFNKFENFVMSRKIGKSKMSKLLQEGLWKFFINP